MLHLSGATVSFAGVLTTISSDINNSTTTVPVASASGLSAQQTVLIGTEKLLIKSISGTDLTVIRGALEQLQHPILQVILFTQMI